MTRTIILSGAAIALPDRLLPSGALVIEGAHIVEVSDRPRPRGAPGGGAGSGGEVTYLDLTGHLIVPGFIDVHVHGLEGHDGLAEAGGVAEMARRLPRYGVTGFCPTTIACSPEELATMLAAVRAAQVANVTGAARVLPAHLESNFINPEYRGAQPLECIRRPPTLSEAAEPPAEGFTGEDVLRVIEAYRAEVGIVTLAPELPGAIDFTRSLVDAGHRVSLGHSGATFDEAMAGVAAGARQATHLFNRMTPFGHREPGLTGAVLHAEELAAELICDGHHVHPATAQLAIALKRPSRVMAITDGTAGAGLPVGARVNIGGRPITVTPTAAYLDDGTLAGSVLTMDKAFRLLVNTLRLAVVDAAVMCATTPARELKLEGRGAIAPGAVADLAVLDPHLQVVQTYVDGTLAFPGD